MRAHERRRRTSRMLSSARNTFKVAGFLVTDRRVHSDTSDEHQPHFRTTTSASRERIEPGFAGPLRARVAHSTHTPPGSRTASTGTPLAGLPVVVRV